MRGAQSLARYRGTQGQAQASTDALAVAIKDTVDSPVFTQACPRLGARPAYLPADRFGPQIAKEDAELSQG